MSNPKTTQNRMPDDSFSAIVDAVERLAFINEPENQQRIEAVIQAIFPVYAERRFKMRDAKMAGDVVTILTQALWAIDKLQKDEAK
jgi:hypothetical protein